MKRTLKITGLLAGLAMGATLATPATAQDPFTGQLQQFGMNWCPEGWHRADGSLLSIAQYPAVYSLLGTRYGGDGSQTFGLPDLRTRMPVGYNAQLPISVMTGTTTTTLLLSNLPTHTHDLQGDETGPVTNQPNGTMLGTFPTASPIYSSGNGTVPMNVHIVQITGGNQPVTIQSPILATNWCIALEGIYPPRPD
ncbi:tail fiber protein [Brevundimonas sp.]|uniref:phage tail protein n=1 Tax=Brevundimonas sp. TaxID=1871086 RepID=UPI001DA743E0|nr:tail fiber protein [Brevundimonas sp.]MBL0948782.1 tail fiber protein [Brevundimonas sp.]